MKITLAVLYLVTVVILCLTTYSKQDTIIVNPPSNVNRTAIYITQNFADVIDAATAAYITTTKWTTSLADYGVPYNVPTCASSPAWPSTFDFKSDVMTMCYELETNAPWDKIHELAGTLLLEQVNAKYKRSIQPQFIKLNTTKLGYWETLKQAANFGDCNVIIASNNYDLKRAADVHFQCMYGSSGYGYLRSELDLGTIIINSDKDINSTNVTVATFGGTIYDTYVTNNFQAANIIRNNAGWVDIFQMVLNKKIHIMVAEATDLRNWLSLNKYQCNNCTTKIMGIPFSYSSFVTKNIIASSSSTLVMNLAVVLMSLFVAFSF